MALAIPTLATIRDAIRLEVMDTDTAAPRMSDAQYLAVINRAIRNIAKDTHYLERISGIYTDGIAPSFDLNGTLPENLAEDFFGMGMVYYNGLPLDMETELQQPELVSTVSATGATDYGRTPVSVGRYSLYRERMFLDFLADASSNMITDPANDSLFATVGTWTAVLGTLSAAANTLLYTVNGVINGSVHTITLPATSMSSQIRDRCYIVTGLIKKGAAYAGGNITITAGGETAVITPTTSYQRFTIKLQHKSVDTAVVITFASGLGIGNTVSLQEVYFYDCPLAIAYYAIPTALAGDSDTPEGMLAQFDDLIIYSSLLTLPEWMNVDQRKSKVMRDEQMASFKKYISTKGKKQRQTTRANFYGI